MPNVLTNAGTIDNTGILNAAVLDNLGTIDNTGTLALTGTSSDSSTVLDNTGGTLINTGLASLPRIDPGGTLVDINPRQTATLDGVTGAGHFDYERNNDPDGPHRRRDALVQFRYYDRLHSTAIRALPGSLMAGRGSIDNCHR